MGDPIAAPERTEIGLYNRRDVNLTMPWFVPKSKSLGWYSPSPRSSGSARHSSWATRACFTRVRRVHAGAVFHGRSGLR